MKQIDMKQIKCPQCNGSGKVFVRQIIPPELSEKCQVEFMTAMGKLKCNNKMPCPEHNFVAFMEESKKFPPEWAGGSGDE